MHVHVPVPARPVQAAVPRRTPTPPTLGVIDDGFGATLLPPVLDELRTTLGLEDVIYHRKANLSARADPGTFDDLASRCRAVVVGICA